jgi:hypothetical protein
VENVCTPDLKNYVTLHCFGAVLSEPLVFMYIHIQIVVIKVEMLVQIYYFSNILLILQNHMIYHGINTQFFQKKFGKFSPTISKYLYD